MVTQLTNKNPNVRSIPDGQERLATQLERDDVNRSIAARNSKPHSERLSVKVPPNSPDHRESGDEVNRFLLCTLVNDASRHIKARAERAGVPLPMSAIVRGVLRSYRLEATDRNGPLADPVLDIVAIQKLSARVLGSEIARHDRDRAKRSESKTPRADRTAVSGNTANDRIADVIELGLQLTRAHR
jgi:hypothetical protein